MLFSINQLVPIVPAPGLSRMTAGVAPEPVPRSKVFLEETEHLCGGWQGENGGNLLVRPYLLQALQ